MLLFIFCSKYDLCFSWRSIFDIQFSVNCTNEINSFKLSSLLRSYRFGDWESNETILALLILCNGFILALLNLYKECFLKKKLYSLHCLFGMHFITGYLGWIYPQLQATPEFVLMNYGHDMIHKIRRTFDRCKKIIGDNFQSK